MVIYCVFSSYVPGITCNIAFNSLFLRRLENCSKVDVLLLHL